MEDMQISDVSSFLSWVKEIKSKEQAESLFPPVDPLFFRGHANKDWPITPYVFRTDQRIYDEYELVRNARSLAWSYLQGASEPLDMLVRLQHFGLPTRLLDITHNPLAALYFACADENQMDNDGCVYWGDTDLLKGEEFAKIIAQYALSEDRYSCTASALMRLVSQRFFGKCENIITQDINVLKSQLCKPYYVLPPYNNERIKAQMGAFIITPLLKSDKKANTISIFGSNHEPVDFRNITIDDGVEQKPIFQPSKCIVCHDKKKDILEELSKYGINKHTLFPDDVSALMQHIAKSTSSINISKILAV